MKNKQITLSQSLSKVPFKIGMFVGKEELATGTAFVYPFEGGKYLITNWHNVSGRRPHDYQPISKTGGIPNRMVLTLPVLVDVAGVGNAIGWKDYGIDLYANTDDYKDPEWWEHPKHGPAVDAVAIELKGLEDTITVAANDVSLDLQPFQIWSGMDVFVLGFPKGISGGGGLPIWKRGSIASEPDVDLGGLPLFYIDTATRPGNSGSPVYAQASGFWPVEGKKFPEEAFLGTGYRFVGIYSGRIAIEEDAKPASQAEKLERQIYEAQLGKVWKEQAIVETIQARTPGKSSFGLGPKGADKSGS